MSMTKRPSAEEVCAIVVTFFPDAGVIERLRTLREQVSAMVVIDNTPGDLIQKSGLPHALQELNALLIANGENLGIAAALNQGLQHAIRHGFQWALTMDQDTTCRHGMVQSLLCVAGQVIGVPVIVGGNYFDASFDRAFVNPKGAENYVDQVTVITSGNLIPVEFAVAIGGFREDYFIDQVDHEFCLRARSRGARVVISREVVMDHSVGGPGGVFVPYLGTFPEHAPIRKYYIARNTLVTVLTYWRQEPKWCLRRLFRLTLGLVAMLIVEKRGLSKARAFFVGIADGCRKISGACEHPWLIRGGDA